MDNKFYYMLAPINGVTDSSFRTICLGADLTMTEITSLEALTQGNDSALKKIRLYDDTPTEIQIIGQREPSLKKFLSGFKPQKGFKGFNLNLGCPDPRFVNEGLGCALVKRVSKVARIIDMIKSHGYSASIKMRLGLNKYEKDNKAYLNLINNVDADFFIVHARHGKQTYKDKADWKVFPECVRTKKVIIANGDIRTKEDVDKMKKYGCRGVMIGRAAVANPLIFAELKGMATPSLDKVKAEYDALLTEREAKPEYRKNVLMHFGEEMRLTNQNL